AATASGLDGIVAAETRLSDVDGEQGRLVIAGHDVEAIAGSVRFEQACALLWTGAADEASSTTLARELGEARRRAFERLGALGDALDARHGMDALRAATAHLSAQGDSHADAATVTGALAVFAAAWARRRTG